MRPVMQHPPLNDDHIGWTLWSRVIGHARCADTDLDPDEWSRSAPRHRGLATRLPRLWPSARGARYARSA